MIFLDSSVLIAKANKHDEAHGRATAILEEIDQNKYGSCVINDYVFDETLTTVLSRTRNLKLAIETGEKLLEDTEMIYSDIRTFSAVFERFRKQEGLDLSFTDCSIIETCRANGITRLATFDRKLEEASGLDVVG